jgi:DNA-binding transcriptional MerR regulator
MRISGQRRYQPEASNLVAVLLLAKSCGFSLDEMRRLVSEFRPGTPARERWQTAICEHQKVLEQQIAQLNGMRKLLRRVQRCQCVDMNECGRLASALVGSGLSR